MSAVAMAEPAWDLLLALYGTQEDAENIAVGKLTSMAGLSLTTALRWIVRLERDGLVAREADPSDARVVKIHLTVRGERAMRDSFAAARQDS